MHSPACWGYESTCDTTNRLSNPDCSGDSKSWWVQFEDLHMSHWDRTQRYSPSCKKDKKFFCQTQKCVNLNANLVYRKYFCLRGVKCFQSSSIWRKSSIFAICGWGISTLISSLLQRFDFCFTPNNECVRSK